MIASNADETKLWMWRNFPYPRFSFKAAADVIIALRTTTR